MNQRPIIPHLIDLLQQTYPRSTTSFWVGSDDSPLVEEKLGRELEDDEIFIKRDDGAIFLLKVTKIDTGPKPI